MMGVLVRIPISIFRKWRRPLGIMSVRCFGLAINFGVLAGIGRWSGQQNLGIVIALGASAVMGAGLCGFGIPTLLLKTLTSLVVKGELALASMHYLRAIKISISGSSCLMLLAIVIASGQVFGIAPGIFGTLGPAEILSIGVGSLGLGMQFIGFSVLRALRRPGLSAFFQFCTQPVLLLFSISLVSLIAGADTTGVAAISFSMATLLNAYLVHLVAKSLLPPASCVKLESFQWKESRSLWAIGVLSTATSSMPLLLGALLLTPDHMAVLGVPYRICNLPMTVLSSLGAFYAPAIREAYLKKDTYTMRNVLAESQWFGIVLVLPVALVAVILPDQILRLFGIEDNAAPILLLIMCVGQLWVAGCGVCEHYLVMCGESAQARNYNIFGFLLAVLLGTVAGLEAGAVGLALSWVITASMKQTALRIKCGRLGHKSFNVSDLI